MNGARSAGCGRIVCVAQEAGHFNGKNLWSITDARPDERVTCDRPLPKLVSREDRKFELEKTEDNVA